MRSHHVVPKIVLLSFSVGVSACAPTFTTAPSDAGHESSALDANDGGGKETGAKEAGRDASEHESGADTGDASAAMQCDSLAVAYCDYLAACQPGALAGGFGTSAVCETAETGLCEEELEARGSGVTVAWAEACAASFVTRTSACASGPVAPSVPSPSDPCAIVGGGGGGAACGLDAQCQTAVCDHMGTACGTCSAPLGSGDACGPSLGTCARGLVCSATTHVCVSLVGAGEVCDFGKTAVCTLGMDCVVAKLGDKSGVCAAAGTTEGTPCDTKHVGVPGCSDIAGLYCDTMTNECAKITYGTSCGADAGASVEQCLGGACLSGSCIPILPTGHMCVVGAIECSVTDSCVSADAGTFGSCTPLDVTCGSDGGSP
jgi:hypothetical protein